MTATVGEMSPSELHEMIDFIIEQKLRELLGDEDEGLQLREEIATRLQKQRSAIIAGDRGRSLNEIASRFETD
ncbi:MAG: hypothetical protein LC131_06170 [Anaerolineae bacterium]|nr:hypothetical protein [Anaerolineae bacterium]